MLGNNFIIDTFLFSEPHEADLLYLKFVLENDCVDIWVLQENAYSTQGHYKGLFAEEVLQQERFSPFLDKVAVVSAESQVLEGHDEGHNFGRENWQRQLCLQLFAQAELPRNSLVIVSDTDEMVDFSDEQRRNRLVEIFERHAQNDVVYIGRMRYWFDYDNRAYIPCIRIPFIPIKRLAESPILISQVRHHHGITYDAGEEPLAFEYSYVFKSIEDVWRKKCTYAHTNFTYESIKIALECNHWPRCKERGETVGADPMDWFEKVELTESNSPKYVRDNLEYLRTNIVDPDYKLNRKNRYEN